MEELFNETVGNLEDAVKLGYPVRAVTLSEVKGGIVPEELLKESVGNLDAAVDDMVLIIDGLELLEENDGTPDEAEEVPLRQPSASGFGGGLAHTHLETDELVVLLKDVEIVEFATLGNPLISLALMVKTSINGC